MDKNPLVSIVILNRNGKRHLKRCLSSLLRTNYSNYEIILADNASSDGSIEFVKRAFPQIKIVQNEHNVGIPAGYNSGILQAKGKYVATLNNDIEVDPEWLQSLVKVMEASPDVAAVDPKYLNYYDKNKFDTCAAAGRYIDFVGNPVTRGIDEEDRGQYDEITRTFICSTFWRREVLEKIGLLDEDFFYGFDDTDVSWRISLRGYRILYVPSSRIYHKVGGYTLLRNARAQLRYIPGIYFFLKRNRLLTIVKNYSLKTLLRLLPLALLEHLGYIVYWSIKRDKQYSFESFKATLWILKNFKKIWVKHRFVQSIRKVKDHEIMKLMAPYFGDPIKFLSNLAIGRRYSDEDEGVIRYGVNVLMRKKG